MPRGAGVHGDGGARDGGSGTDDTSIASGASFATSLFSSSTTRRPVRASRATTVGGTSGREYESISQRRG